MNVKLKPLGDRVILRFVDAEERVGSIVIPDTAKEKPTQGIVEAVGDGRLDEKGVRVPMQVKPGDKVIFGRYAGTQVRLNNEDLMIVHETEILAVL